MTQRSMRTADIASILDHIATLQELDTSNVEPTYQVTDLEFVSRPDVVEVSPVDRETLLALAPDQANHQIKVPKVL
ncbi:MAG TPA: Asp-tRNA(Asn)/Glu-tRNA(Gln) amidotransferase subunit GatC [Candidatus Saccharimonadaceae bacterium]|nr:Asp-tRNA(Asn)/Glu-tRNA(Gln) amidotransferase subunit GatC [Candidatus Saccharimonadaceae bacterium]